MKTHSTRRKLGTREVAVHDVEHIRLHYDDHLYLYAPNRGGLWNFGDGELAIAYLAGPVDYQAPLPPGKPGPYRHSHPIAERGARAGGVLLSRSFDYGQTWPENERSWIWHNDRSDNEILDWLRPRAPEQREQIDLTQPDSIIHFCHGEYLRFPFGGRDLRNDPQLPPGINFHLGRREHPPSFSLRSPDRGRTWERHATLIEGPSWAPEGGFLCVNLGHVRFDNGVLGMVGATYRRNVACFYASYDNGLSWEYVSEIARAAYAPDMYYGYSYLGVHRLPDDRLLCLMHRLPENWPHVAFSEDDGMNWSTPRAIVSPATYNLPLTGPPPDRAPGDDSGPRYRSPRALVLRDGRILVLFARRDYPARGGRGILGVVSNDLGETWSEEFVVRDGAYCWDLGYPVVTELPDGRLFTAYWFTTKDGDEPVHERELVRYIAGTFFRLD